KARAENLAKAESLAKKVAADSGAALAAHLQLARIAMDKRDRSTARLEAVRALTLSPDSIAALRAVVGIDVVEKNFAHAKSLVDARLTRSPKEPAVLLVAADLSRETGDLAGE